MSAYANTKLVMGLFAVDCAVFGSEEKTKLNDSVDSLCDCDGKGHGKVKSMGFECESCHKHYNAAFLPPLYGFPSRPDKAKNHEYKIVIRKDEVKVKDERSPIDVQKVITLEELFEHFTINGTYYILPEDVAQNNAGSKLYKLYVEVLAKNRAVLLATFVARNKKERYAIMADKSRGVLLALKIGDMAQLPYDPPDVKVSSMEEQQVSEFIKAMKTDTDFPAPPDLLAKRIKEELEGQLSKALESVPIPKEAALPTVAATTSNADDKPKKRGAKRKETVKM